MPYAIRGLLSQMEDVKRRMQGPLTPPSDAFQLPQQGGPPQGAPPPPQVLPVAEPPSPPPPVAKGRGGLLSANVPAEYGQMFSPEELAQAKPGKIQSLLGRIIGESPTGIMRSNLDEMAKRKVGVGKYQDEQTTREQAATLKQQMDGLRREAAANGMGFPEFAQRLAMIRPELSAQLAGMVNAMEPPATKAESHIPDGSWVPDGKGGWRRIGGKAGENVTEGPHLGGIAQFKDGNFEKWVVRPAAEKDNTVGQSMAAQREFQRVTSLQSDFANDPTVKQAKLYASAFQGIQAAAQENNPQTNLAMMYEAVKMRDPNAVREGELALQKSARSVPTWLRVMWTKAEKGHLLSVEEREQIVDWAGEKINQQGKLITPIQKRFGETARRFGVAGDSTYIAPNPFEGVTTEAGAPKKRLSAPDAAKAKTDAKFAAWAKANGYEVP